MATLIVRFYTLIRHLLGIDCLSLEADNVDEVMTQLEEKFEAQLQERLRTHGIIPNIKLRDFCLLLLNGQTIDKQNLRQIKLKEGDILQIFPPAAGG